MKPFDFSSSATRVEARHEFPIGRRSLIAEGLDWLVLSMILSLFLLERGQAQELFVTPANDRGVYLPNQSIRWNLETKGADVLEANYVLKKGGLTELSRGKIGFSNGKGQIEAKLEDPGWLLVEVSISGTNGKPVKALGGALVSPEKIQAASPKPADFDFFWQSKLTELSAVPGNVALQRVDAGRPEIDCFRITMDNIRGSKIHGQLARPKTGDRLPALLIVQWAGVYPLQKDWITGRAGEGWLVLNINAHDLPIDEPEPFYKDQAAGRLKDYPAIGNDDRETSYFLRMYLSCYRAAEYLTGRADWDGRTLVVTGGSQGGLQAIVTAALHPRVTGVMACVPAGCDLNGPEASRLPGWPMWYSQTQGKDEAKVRQAARYYDVVNFAAQVRCPVLIGVGLIDTVCPPPGIFAAGNRFRGPKEILVMPAGEHGEKNGSHRPYYDRFNAWNQAFLKGDPAPAK